MSKKIPIIEVLDPPEIVNGREGNLLETPPSDIFVGEIRSAATAEAAHQAALHGGMSAKVHNHRLAEACGTNCRSKTSKPGRAGLMAIVFALSFGICAPAA